MAESFKMSAGSPGANKDYRDRIKKPFVKPLTLKYLISWINQQTWDEYTKSELIKKASAYPSNALSHFAEMVNVQVIKIHKERTKQREKNEKELQMQREAEVRMCETKEGTSSTDSISISGEELL